MLGLIGTGIGFFISSVGSVIGAVFSPLILLIIPLTALIALMGVFALAWKENWGGIRDIIKGVIVEKIIPWLRDKLMPWIRDELPDKLRLLKEKAKEVFLAILNFFNEYVIPFYERWKERALEFATWWDENWNRMSLLLGGFFRVILGIFQIGWSLFAGFYKVLMNVFMGDWESAWESVKDVFSGVWGGIVNILIGYFELMLGIFYSYFQKIADVINDVIDGFNKLPSWMRAGKEIKFKIKLDKSELKGVDFEGEDLFASRGSSDGDRNFFEPRAEDSPNILSGQQPIPGNAGLIVNYNVSGNMISSRGEQRAFARQIEVLMKENSNRS